MAGEGEGEGEGTGDARASVAGAAQRAALRRQSMMGIRVSALRSSVLATTAALRLQHGAARQLGGAPEGAELAESDSSEGEMQEAREAEAEAEAEARAEASKPPRALQRSRTQELLMDDLAQLSAAGSSRSCALWGAAGTPTGAAGTQADVATGLAAASAAGSAASFPTRADSFGRGSASLGGLARRLTTSRLSAAAEPRQSAVWTSLSVLAEPGAASLVPAPLSPSGRRETLRPARKTLAGSLQPQDLGARLGAGDVTGASATPKHSDGRRVSLWGLARSPTEDEAWELTPSTSPAQPQSPSSPPSESELSLVRRARSESDLRRRSVAVTMLSGRRSGGPTERPAAGVAPAAAAAPVAGKRRIRIGAPMADTSVTELFSHPALRHEAAKRAKVAQDRSRSQSFSLMQGAGGGLGAGVGRATLVEELKEVYGVKSPPEQEEDAEMREQRMQFESDSMLMMRESIRFSSRIRSLFTMVWIAADSDHSGQLDKDEYLMLNRKLQVAVLGHYDRVGGRALAEEDWAIDARGEDFLNYARFASSWFQIVDLWTDTVSEPVYFSFLNQLTQRLLMTAPDGTLRFREDSDIVSQADYERLLARRRVKELAVPANPTETRHIYGYKKPAKHDKRRQPAHPARTHAAPRNNEPRPGAGVAVSSVLELVRGPPVVPSKASSPAGASAGVGGAGAGVGAGSGQLPHSVGSATFYFDCSGKRYGRPLEPSKQQGGGGGARNKAGSSPAMFGAGGVRLGLVGSGVARGGAGRAQSSNAASSQCGESSSAQTAVGAFALRMGKLGVRLDDDGDSDDELLVTAVLMTKPARNRPYSHYGNSVADVDDQVWLLQQRYGAGDTTVWVRPASALARSRAPRCNSAVPRPMSGVPGTTVDAQERHSTQQSPTQPTQQHQQPPKPTQQHQQHRQRAAALLGPAVVRKLETSLAAAVARGKRTAIPEATSKTGAPLPPRPCSAVSRQLERSRQLRQSREQVDVTARLRDVRFASFRDDPREALRPSTAIGLRRVPACQHGAGVPP